MNRPLVSVVIAYAAGLLLAQIFQPPPAALLGPYAVRFDRRTCVHQTPPVFLLAAAHAGRLDKFHLPHRRHFAQ